MTTNHSERGKRKKPILAAVLILGGTTLAFQGITQVAAGTEYNKTKVVSTNYDTLLSDSSKAEQDTLPEGYKKENYKIDTIDLEYFQNQFPTNKDMSKEQAAEIGAQALWKIFGVSLEGQVLEMGFDSATDWYPRSKWYADVLIDGKHSFSFSVDSVTGDVLDISNVKRNLSENVSVAFDSELDKNPHEYVELAKETAESFDIVHGPVASVEYNGQGYGNNDPDISIEVKGENGETALLSFSRYDKALQGIVYHASYKYTLEQTGRLKEEMQHLPNNSSDAVEEPTLLHSFEE